MYFMDIVYRIEDLSGKQIEILKYLIQRMQGSENAVIITTNELAKKTNTSRKTVSTTLKKLRENGVIETRFGAIKFIQKEN